MTSGCSVDLSWVAPSLAVGGSFRPVQVGELRACGIRRVVDMRAECCDDARLLALHGIELLALPTPDLCAVAPAALDRGVAWAAEAMDRGHRVLVHCEYGIGRSVSLACCVLVARGMRLDEALALLKRARDRVSPSPAQLDALLAWARARGGAPPELGWSDLAAIVYRAAA